MGEFLSATWIVVGIVMILVLLFVIPILIEIKKTLQAYRIISERIEMVTDVKEWFNIVKLFKKSKKD